MCLTFFSLVRHVSQLCDTVSHLFQLGETCVSPFSIPGSNTASRHNGAFRGGFRGSQIQKSGRLSNGWTDWHQIWNTSADSSGNGHRLNTIRPSTLRGLGGSQIKKSGEDSNGWSDWLQICRFIWEWIYAKQIAPRDKRGHLGGFRGSNNQRSGNAVIRLDRLAPTLVHICGFIWEWV